MNGPDHYGEAEILMQAAAAREQPGSKFACRPGGSEHQVTNARGALPKLALAWPRRPTPRGWAASGDDSATFRQSVLQALRRSGDGGSLEDARVVRR